MSSADDERQAALDDLRRAMERVALIPSPSAKTSSEEDEDWTAAVYDRGETPYGRCSFCNVPRSPAGCLNLCEMSAGHVRVFNAGLQAVINKERERFRAFEILGECSCGPACLSGYQVERESHQYGCPMRTERPGQG